MIKKISITAISFLLFAFASTQSFAKVKKRSVSNVTQINPTVDCRHIGILENQNRILIERVSFTDDDLSAEHEFGVKGVYIDLYGTGGYRIYKDSSNFSVEVEAEGLGVIDNLSFSSLPFQANLPVQIELSGSRLVETRLICLTWSEARLRQ